MHTLPKSVQLSEMLIRDIASGRLPDGARLPTERELAKEHSVAVGTLRKALRVLEEKRLIRRVQGSGNYVQAQANVDSIYSFFRLELNSGGGLPTAEILGVERCRRPKPAEAFLSGYGFRIRRQRFLDDVPIAVEEIWLDAEYADSLKREELSESLYYFYKTKFGLVISRIEDRIGTATVPDWAPDNFELIRGGACGFIERFSFDQTNRMSEYSRTWFDSDVARYVNRLL